MNWDMRGGFGVVLALVLATAAVSSSVQSVQPGRLDEPIPEQTVDPVISPMVYQGGTVVMRVTVAASGAVARVEVVKPFPALSEPVAAAVRQWRFKPAVRDGVAIEATTTVVVHVAIVRAVVGD